MAKRHLNVTERVVGRSHANGLAGRPTEDLEAGTLYLAILRYLRRVDSHLSAVANDVLGMTQLVEIADELAARDNEPVGDIRTIEAE